MPKDAYSSNYLKLGIEEYRYPLTLNSQVDAGAHVFSTGRELGVTSKSATSISEP
jgi:hypothetical protein